MDSRRGEYNGFTQKFKKDYYKPDVKMGCVEETGQKQAHHFYAKGSGKRKTEQWMRKLEEILLKTELQRNPWALCSALGPVHCAVTK